MSDSTAYNLLVGSWDLSTVSWGDKAKCSGETFHGAAVADLGAGQQGIKFPTESHRADARATSGAEYVLSFWARADVDGDRIHSEVWGSLYMLDAELTTEWRLVSMPYGIRKADARNVYFWGLGTNSGSVHVALPMCVRGTEPAAWAPAEGESLTGGGALMSANLLEGVTPTLMHGTTESDGVWHNAGRTIADDHEDWLVWDLAGQSALATNQTYHVGLSTRGAGANSASLHATIGYKDAAGNVNWATSDPLPIGTSWGRAEATIVVPSGMTPFGFYVAAYGTCPETWMANPTLSLGSPVPLASSAHTPYATQDHVAAEYATKAALKVTSDAVTAEVEERGKLAGKVGTLESTSGTHTSKLEQLASSIRSLVKGESTYTDPDGKSATSGIYSLVTQTRDSVTALFGSYTKTEDLASTQAVKDAKKAGTDAASAASAAQSTADEAKSNAATAQSTADEAKSTAQTAASDAATAKTNASTAVSTANSAKSTAQTASTNASNAVSTANSANSKSDSAVSTANSAKSTAASASSTANAAKSIVDGMKLGGRNLLKGTSMDVVTGTHPSSSYKDYLVYTTIDVPDGDTYTLSFDAKSTHAGDVIHCYFYSPNTTLTGVSSTGMKFDSGIHPDGNLLVELTDGWQRYWCTWTQSATTTRKNVIPFRYFATEGSGTVSMRGVKLEAGNKATDWSPAPEDTDSAVADAKKAGTDAQTSANSAQKAADKAQSSADAAQGTADSAKSAAQAAASDAATAKTNAASAVSTANSASTSAANAVKTANAASSTASSASSTANSAASTANAAKDTADSAESAASRAQSTADAALDNAGTANGRVRAVEAKFSASIDGLDVRVRGVSEAVSAQGATVRDVERNMSFGLDGLVIGAADSASKVRITEKRETFEVDGKTVLALDGDTSTVEASALKIGGYVWTATNGGKNLTLVYRG